MILISLKNKKAKTSSYMKGVLCAIDPILQSFQCIKVADTLEKIRFF
jgi:hypothetical protein